VAEEPSMQQLPYRRGVVASFERHMEAA
jgi:hypothetical protein